MELETGSWLDEGVENGRPEPVLNAAGVRSSDGVYSDVWKGAEEV